MCEASKASNRIWFASSKTSPPEDEILVRVGGSRRRFLSRLGRSEVCSLAMRSSPGFFGSRLTIEMLQNEILLLGGRADEEVDVGETEPLRKNREQRDPLVRPGNLRLQRGFGRV